MAPSRIPFFNHSDHQHDPNRRDSSYHTFPERQEPHRPDSGLEEPTLAGVARAAATAAGLDAARPTVDQRSSQQKFQTAARRAMSARKMLSYKKIGDSREPGVDARKVDLPDLHQKLVIQAVDFSRTAADFRVLGNDELPAFLDKPRTPGNHRWVHVNGLSWDVLKALALHYDLHPLAVEDVLHHGTAATRSKADYYHNHLFVSVIVHKTSSCDDESEGLMGKPGPSASKDDVSEISRPALPQNNDEEAQFDFDSNGLDGSEAEARTLANSLRVIGKADESVSSYDKYAVHLAQAFSALKNPSSEGKDGSETRSLTTNNAGLRTTFRRIAKGSAAGSRADRMAASHTVSSFTKDLRVHIHVEQLSVFLLRDGTIISMTQDGSYNPRFSEIFTRMSSQGDLIRETEDCSMILQALLDTVGDHVLEIVDEFRDQLTRLESRVLSNPDMGDVRHLHILSAQLILLKSTVTPLQHLIQSLRLQDDAKASAASKVQPEDGKKPVGYVSFEAKIFLGDVMDHVESALSSLDLFSSLAENLIAYTFNDLSYSSNAYMKGLSVLSVVFLPLTFLSGYFGMNFQTFAHVLDGDVSYFWKIAIPTAVVTTLVFSWQYLLEIVLSAQRGALRVYHRSLYKSKYD